MDNELEGALKLLKCTGCGRIHVGVTEANALADISFINEYFARFTYSQQQGMYGGKCASIERYKMCHNCGASSETFLPTAGFKNSNAPMQQVIAREP